MKAINNIAYLIQQICLIAGVKPGKSTLQKMVYLVQMNGVDLGFKYKPHCYGVYSETLESGIDFLITNNIVHVERKGNSCLMDVDSSYTIESDLGKETEKKLKRIIEKYKEKPSSELALVTATHYVRQKSPDSDASGIVRGVQKIIGTKYSEKAINEVIEEMD